eukprot:5047343-Alexandrium_andersonii.AAC.1
MSASLVGSEMCIRDSPRTVQVACGWRAWLTHWCAVSRSQPGSIATGAVSYTHLTLPTICSV